MQDLLARLPEEESEGKGGGRKIHWLVPSGSEAKEKIRFTQRLIVLHFESLKNWLARSVVIGSL
jgi:hypothetical protein